MTYRANLSKTTLHFVPALDVITEKLNLPHDVAGATFMAAGGSAPELFTSVIGVFLTQSNVGIGTIVGSAVFNILFVLGACAFVVGNIKDPKTGLPTVLDLTAFPLTRDTIFYIISLVAVIVAFKTGTEEHKKDRIEWWEATYMFLIYIAYVVFMLFNKKVEDMCTSGNKQQKGQVNQAFEGEQQIRKDSCVSEIPTIAGSEMGLPKSKNVSTSDEVGKVQRAHSATWQNLARKTSDLNKQTSIASFVFKYIIDRKRKFLEKAMNGANLEEIQGLDGDAFSSFFTFEGSSSSSGPSCLAIFCKIISFPLALPMLITVPDVKYKSTKAACCGNTFILTFIMSIVWIIIYSYLMVWWATRIGETWNIDSAIMGLTFLAAGTSVPDLITSVLVAKEGYGNMAVSSSIGSNIFDVTVGLPIPWLLATLIFDKPVIVSSDGLGCSIGLLLLMLVLLITSIMVCGWKMNMLMGFMMLVLYVGFVIVSLLLEYKYVMCPF